MSSPAVSLFLASANLTTRGCSAPGMVLLSCSASMAASQDAHELNCTNAQPVGAAGGRVGRQGCQGGC